MAEKYGTIPKKFTVDWWKYFWDYYKWHTIATVLAILLVGFSIHECATAEKFDLTVVHFSNISYGDDNIATVETALEEFVKDADKNGEKNVSLMDLTMMGDAASPQYDQAIQTKFRLSLQEKLTYIYLVDADMCADMYKTGALSELFLPISEWKTDVQSDVPQENGGEYALSLEGSKILEDNGCSSQNLYLLIKPQLVMYDKEAEAVAFEGAFSVAKELLKK